MKLRSYVLQAVKQFAKEIGAPEAIIADSSKEQKSKELRQFLTEIGSTLRLLEENTHWVNKAELYINIIKEAVRNDMKESDYPLSLWGYYLERRVRIHNLTAKGCFNLHGSNAHTDLLSETGDISNLCTYKWYEWCYFRENREKNPFQQRNLRPCPAPCKRRRK